MRVAIEVNTDALLEHLSYAAIAEEISRQRARGQDAGVIEIAVGHAQPPHRVYWCLVEEDE